jgi:hypothetical protein
MAVITTTTQYTATADQVKAAQWLAALLVELGIPTGDGDTDADVVVSRRGYVAAVGYDSSQDELFKANADLIETRSTEAGHAFRVITRKVNGDEFAYVTNRPKA